MPDRDDRQPIASGSGGSERERDIKPMADSQGDYHRPDSAARDRYNSSIDESQHRDHQNYPPYPPQQQNHQNNAPHNEHSQQHHQPQQHHQQQHHAPHSLHLNVEERSVSASPDASRPTSSLRKPAYVPGWTVPPRVLLVEDDAVCRKLSSKFLQIFGCEIDVAVDGVSAVSKMNQQKYDLVLMVSLVAPYACAILEIDLRSRRQDIVMPNLDGVSATSLIRQFDPMTPIISMTSNSGPNEIMTYFSHGACLFLVLLSTLDTDGAIRRRNERHSAEAVLEGITFGNARSEYILRPSILPTDVRARQKHLIHLKVIQQMAEIPRALGFTDNQIQDAVADSTVGEAGLVENPFSAMGISDSDYVEMLQGIALEKEGKRGLEVVQGDEREGKRLRFQEVEEVH